MLSISLFKLPYSDFSFSIWHRIFISYSASTFQTLLLSFCCFFSFLLFFHVFCFVLIVFRAVFVLITKVNLFLEKISNTCHLWWSSYTICYTAHTSSAKCSNKQRGPWSVCSLPFESSPREANFKSVLFPLAVYPFTLNKFCLWCCSCKNIYLTLRAILQTTLFIPTLDTTTKFVIMTIWLPQNLHLRGNN